ncbi:MAG: mechanosensitive ion channel family protein [Candidatus Aenigmatarchaeota archaeon]
MAITDIITPLNVVEAVIVIVSAYLLSSLFKRMLIKPLEKRGEKRSVIIPMKRAISLVIYLIAFVLILYIFEIDITAAVAGLGVGAIVIGFGLQDIITNWISGIIITTGNIYKIDDVIRIGDITGVVKDIRLRSTILTTYDRNDVIIPNSMIVKEKVINLTGGKRESVSSINFSIDYTSDTEKAKKVIEAILRKNENVIVDEKRRREIRFIIRSKEWTTEIETLFWINEPKKEEFIKSRITEAIKKSFEKENILPPVPGFLRKDYLDSKIKHGRRKR